MRRSEIIILVLIVFAFAVGIYFYPQMPEKIVSHWNMQGEADGYLSKFWGVFLIPLILIGLAIIFYAIPRIDPLKANIEVFRKYYDGFVLLFFFFLISVYLEVILWNIGVRIDPVILITTGLGVLFFYLGILLENSRRNWFIGIRTPWTLSNEKVWEETHKIGGKLFKIAGIISFIGFLFKNYALFFVFIPIILIVIYTVIYSYIKYRNLMS